MVLRLKIGSILTAILIAFAVLGVFAVGKTLAEGQFVMETADFDTEVEWGEEFSLEGLTILDNRTLGARRIEVTEDMIVSIDDMTTAGPKEAIIRYEGKEYTVHFEVKYRVAFVVGEETVSSQLVMSVDELVLPETAAAPIGYVFSHWDIDTETELSGSVSVNPIYEEIEYPSLDGLTATYGDTLADVVLGSNEHGYWEFLDSADASFGNAGVKELEVRFVYAADPTVYKYAYATVTVLKKTVDFGTLTESFVYDGEEHFPYFETDLECVITGGAQTLPGTYSYSYEIIDDNYTGMYVGTYEITKPTVTVTVSSTTIVYPASVPEFTFTVEGFDNVELLGIEIDAPEFATQVGEYEIGITYTNENVNYIIHNGYLTVVKGDLAVDMPEIGAATFEDKLADIEFIGKYLGTWSWESPETVIDSMDGITAYAIFVHDDPNLNPVRMAIEIGNIQKKTLNFEVYKSTFTYEMGVERVLAYDITGGLYPELYKTLTVLGNTPATAAGRYTRTLTIDDARYQGSISMELVIDKAFPDVDFTKIYEVVWNENLRLESIVLPEGYAWENPNYRITESGTGAYAVIYTPADTANYNTVTAGITVKVAKAAVSVAGVLDSYAKTYDTYKFDIKGSGIAAYYTDGELSIKYYKDGTEVDEIVNAGEYLLVITVTEGKNYLGTTIERSVSVSRATNVQTVLTAQNAIYLDGTDVLTLPENVEGTWTWAESDLGTVGIKTLTAVFTPDADANYLPREVEVTVTVAKRTLSAPEAQTVLNYNGTLQSLGLVSTALYTVSDLGGKNVGAYTATLTLTDSANYQWADGSDTLTLSYSIIPVDNAFTYLPEDNLAFPYLSSLSSLIATAQLGGVKIEYKKVGAYDHEYTETVPANVGAYIVRYTTTDTNCTAILTETRTFSITPIEVIPSPSLLGTRLEYNGEMQTATLKDTTDGIYTVTDTGATNAGETGTVTVTIYNDNYVWADGSKVLVLNYLIVKATNSWTTEPSIDSTVTYGDTPGVYGAAKYDDMLVYHRLLGTDGEFILGLPENVGEYEIMFTTDSVNAYAAEARYSTLTVTKKEIARPTAVGSLVYNGESQVGVSSPVAGDALYGIYTVENGSASLAGSHTATVTIINPNYKWLGTDSDTVEIGYSIAKAEGAVTVTKPGYEFTYSGEDLLDSIKDGAEAANSEQTDLVFTVTSFVTLGGETILTDSIIGAGRYVVTVSVGESANYLASGATITVLVEKQSLSIPTVSDKVYTGSAQSVGVTDNELYTVSGDITATTVGSYSVTFTLRDTDNYEWLGRESETSVTRGYSISTALNEWSVEPENITAVYDGNPVLVTATPLHGTVTVVYTLGGVVVDAPIGVGVYNVTVTATADNYSELIAYRTVTITKASVSVPTAPSLTYNGKEQGITLADASLGVLYTVYAETKATDAGTAASITLKLTDSANYKWSTTASDTVTVSATVAKADIEIDGTPTVSDWSFTDNESLPVSSVIASQKDFPGLTVELLYALSEDGEYMNYASLPKTAGRLNAGTYYVKAKVESTSNYNGDETEAVSFTVSRCELEIPELVNTALVFDGTAKYSGISATALYSVTDNGGTAAGEYFAYITLTDSTNYKWQNETSDTVSVRYEIAKLVFRDAHIDNSGKSAQYGEAISLSATITAELTGVDLGAYVSYLYSDDGYSWYESLEALTAALGVAKLNTGSYLVKTTVADSDNWDGHCVIDSFTVTKKVLSLPAPTPLTYDGTEQSAFAPSTLYTVEGGAATLAGNYTATLTLTDTDNYEWQSTASASVEIGYSVAKATNTWATEPYISASTVTYKDSYTVSGAPLYDTLKYKYKSSTDTEYTFIDSLDELPTDAGSYEIVLYTESTNASALSVTLNITINRKSVTKPASLPAFVYDGGEKTHGITASEGFFIKAETSATNAGETVSVTLGLTGGNYVWSDGTTADITLTSTVAKTGVSFGALSVTDITYTQLPSASVSTDKTFATAHVKYLYSKDKVNYFALEDILVGGYLPAGTYWVKAYAESDNIAYSESTAVSLTVAKATPDAATLIWIGEETDGLYYQNLLKLDSSETKVYYNGTAIEISAFAVNISGSFAGASTVFSITATPTDTDNYNSATFTDTVPLRTVATIGFGGTEYGSIEAALKAAKSGDTVWVKTDSTGKLYITESVDIPAGVTLLLPYGDATDASGRNQSNASTLELVSDKSGTPENERAYFEPSTYYPEKYRMTWVKLAPGVTLTVKGTLELSGEMCGGGGGNLSGHTAGMYATLQLEDGAKIEAYGTIKCFGFIDYAEGNENGSLLMHGGSSISMPFVLYDYKGGTITTAIYEDMQSNKTAPFHQYGFQNLSIDLRLNYGASVIALCNLNANDSVNSTTAIFAGSTTDAFVQLTNPDLSYIESKFDPETKITKVHIYGGAKLNSFSLTVSALGRTETVTSSDFIFGFSWLFDITLDNAEGQDVAEYLMPGQFKLMPGARFVVEKGARLIVDFMTIYDDTFVDFLGGDYPNTGLYPTEYPKLSSLYQTKIEGAMLLVRGEVVATDLAGDVYSDVDSAIIKISGRTTLDTKEPTIIIKGLILGEVEAHQIVTRSLKLIYLDFDGNIISQNSAIIKDETGANYTTGDGKWNTDARVEYITITLPAGVRVSIDSVVILDDEGNFAGFGSYDSDLGGEIHIVAATIVVFHLRADQVVVTNGSTTLTLGTPADVKTAEYEYRWSASENVPTIYSNVPVINFTGYTKLSECTVTYKNLGSPDCYIEIYMKKELTSINIFSAITASFKVTATASTTTGTGSFSKSGRLNVSVDTTIKVYEDDTITVS